mmetsp:Transcript_53807/g.107921  ORF Transcript_53807/g.107921 Transcript_53807/m.107921 type:complete len:208 (-) Transcript_53807:715-1338(-)
MADAHSVSAGRAHLCHPRHEPPPQLRGRAGCRHAGHLLWVVCHGLFRVGCGRVEGRPAPAAVVVLLSRRRPDHHLQAAAPLRGHHHLQCLCHRRPNLLLHDRHELQRARRRSARDDASDSLHGGARRRHPAQHLVPLATRGGARQAALRHDLGAHHGRQQGGSEAARGFDARFQGRRRRSPLLSPTGRFGQEPASFPQQNAGPDQRH